MATKEGRKATDAQLRAARKYDKKAYYKVLVRFHISDEEMIREAAGDSVNGFIVQAVMEKIERERSKE